MACAKRSQPTRPDGSSLGCRKASDKVAAQRLSPISGADVSVVIPARNEQERLPECLRRLRLQTLTGFEILVVDSASTDATSDVAAAAGARVLRVDRPGVGLARQTGFDAVRRAIIVSTDADALPAADWLERLIAPLQDPSIICAYGTIQLSASGRLVAIGHALFRAFQRVNLILGRPICCGPNFAVRAEAFRAVGGFAAGNELPNEAEDVQLAMKLRAIGRVVYLPRLGMDVSARSFAGRKAATYIAHHARVYFRVCWFRRQLAASR